MGTSKDKIVNDLQQQIKQIIANRKHRKISRLFNRICYINTK